MLIEVNRTPSTQHMVSTRIDDEMYYSLEALSGQLNVGRSDLVRLAIANLIIKAREKNPMSWEHFKTL